VSYPGQCFEPGQVFVDESKAHDYLLVAVVIPQHDIAHARRSIRRLVLPGQRRIHMKDERDSRKRQILSVIADLDPEVRIFRESDPKHSEGQRRDYCLDALVRFAARERHLELILELDETLERRDHERLIEAARAAGCTGRLAHRHARASEEPLLVIPDAVGWAWARGGDWKRRLATLDLTVEDV